MSDKQELFRRIDELKELLASLENVRPDEEDAFGFMLSQQSLESKLEELNEELLLEAGRDHQALFDYKIFAGAIEDIKMGAIGHALADFQSLFSTVFEAIKHGPKVRATVDAATAETTAFFFEHSYEGSVGLVFAINDETDLVERTPIEQSVDALFAVAQAQSREEITAFAKQYGAPVIRKLYTWANNNSKYGIGADIQWRKLKASDAAFKLDTEGFLKLKSTIGETSDEQVVPLDVSGILVGIDVDLPSFHINLPEGQTITGSSIAEHLKTKEWIVPRLHKAKLNKKTVVHYAVDKETTTYDLLDLD